MISTYFKFVLGGNSFPAYLAFHSYLVGVEVLFYRSEMGTLSTSPKYHGPTDRITSILIELQQKLLLNQSLFTDCGKKILHDAANKVESVVESV